MKQSFLPKPLVYKEWKEHRWWMIAGMVLVLYGPFSSALAMLQSAHVGTTQVNLLWRYLIPVLYHLHYTTGNGGFPLSGTYIIQGPPAVSATIALVSMGLMIALITVERNRGSLWFTLSFPIRRKDALKVKVVLTFSIITTGIVLDFLLLFCSDLAAGRSIPLVEVVRWLGQNLLISYSFMAVGLASAAVIQIGLVAGLTAFFIAGTPWALGFAVLRSTPSQNNGLTVDPGKVLQAPQHVSLSTAGHLSEFLRSLSPISYFSGSTGFGGSLNGSPSFIYVSSSHSITWVLVIWFLLFILFWGICGWYAYLLVPLENNAKFLLLPQFSTHWWWLVYGLTSFVVVNSMTSRSNQLDHQAYVILGYWLIVWVVFGFIATLVKHFRQTRSG